MSRGKGKAKALAMVQEKAFAPRTNPAKGQVKLVPLKAARARGKGRSPIGWKNSNGGRRRVAMPIAKGMIQRNSGPKFNGGRSVTISHSEYLGEVSGSVGFAITSYSINPGLVSSFPWLANVANQYEEYKVGKLAYRYETEAPSTTKGGVLLVTDYDALDSTFQNKQQALDYQGSTRTPAWNPVKHVVGGRAAKPYASRYVRAGSAPDGSDLKTYDTGNFQIATQGMEDTAVIGELWVDYTFTLIGPKVNNVLGQNLLCADIRGGGVMNSANPLGNAPTVVAGSNISVSVNTNSVTINTSGRYLINYVCTGTGITVLTVSAGGGGSNVTAYSGVVTATAASYIISVDLSANVGQGIVITLTATTVVSATLLISQISSGLLTSKPKAKPKGLPLYREPDPLEQKIAALEQMLARAGLCAACYRVGSHEPGCVRSLVHAACPTITGGL